MRPRRRPLLRIATLVTALALALTAAAAPAFAAFPYTRAGGDPSDFSDLYLNAGQTPSDLSGDDNDFKFAATPDPDDGPQINQNPLELFGVRGAHVNDPSPSVQTAWMTTTGRPDVSIAVLDSGIKWNDTGAMNDLRRKARLSRASSPSRSRRTARRVAPTTATATRSSTSRTTRRTRASTWVTPVASGPPASSRRRT